MKAPLCKLCKAHHWNHEPHQWADSGTNKQPSPKPKKVASPKPAPSPKRDKPASPKAMTAYERNKRWREKYPDKYRESQRELMRKRAASV